MRLGQLARKLEIKTSDIIQYLANQDIEVKDHPNVKLNEALENEVIEHFGGVATDSENLKPAQAIEVAPEPEATNSSESTAQQEDSMISTSEEGSSASASTEIDQEASESDAEEAIDDSLQTTPQQIPKSLTVEEILKHTEQEGETDTSPINLEELLSQVEVIKAPKVELPGLKVLGKIELPDPNEKTNESGEPENEEINQETEEPKIIRHNRRNARKRLTDEEREAKRLRNKKAKEKRLHKQAQKRKEEEERRLKEIKVQHYKQKISKPKSVNKKPKKKVKPIKEVDHRPSPKTILGKFWRWLNT